MYRSILPCRNREAARKGKSRIRKRGRRRAKQAARRGDIDEVATVARMQRVETSSAVGWRQGGDKVNHFCRWGRARTAHLPPEERVAALRGMLGSDGVMAEHALEHFAHEVDRHHLEDRRSRSRNWRKEWEDRRLAEGRPFKSEKVLRRLLRHAFELDHGGLNRVLKQLVLECCDSNSPCKQATGTTACSGRPVIRVPNDLFCVARRIWRDGKRAQEEGSPADKRVSRFCRTATGHAGP